MGQLSQSQVSNDFLNKVGITTPLHVNSEPTTGDRNFQKIENSMAVLDNNAIKVGSGSPSTTGGSNFQIVENKAADVSAATGLKGAGRVTFSKPNS